MHFLFQVRFTHSGKVPTANVHPFTTLTLLKEKLKETYFETSFKKLEI